MELSHEQQLAYHTYIKGRNLFITGPGGSGKSELIRTIYNHAKQNKRRVQVTAMTGCAAILLKCKATTLHSFTGIGLGNDTVDILIEKIRTNRYLKIKWTSIEILVVDEVSMLSLSLFNKLNDIGKAIRKNTRPFGGIQLIFSGDFYQLPPVSREPQQFCFESEEWGMFDQIELVRIFRQTDETYSNILNQIREGKLTRESYDILMRHVGKEVDHTLLIEPTKLFPTKMMVSQLNQLKMDALQGEETTFTLKHIKDMSAIPFDTTPKEVQYELEFMAGNLLCDKEITLKVGAQVMCIINIKSESDDLLICNGSQGIITEFCHGFPKVKYANCEMIMPCHNWESDKIPGIGVSQIPLILSWALTIHKAQGATLDAAEIDAGSGIFECGQTYVALSRVKSLDGLYLTAFDPKKIRIKKKVKEYYDSLTNTTKE